MPAVVTAKRLAHLGGQLWANYFAAMDPTTRAHHIVVQRGVQGTDTELLDICIALGFPVGRKVTIKHNGKQVVCMVGSSKWEDVERQLVLMRAGKGIGTGLLVYQEGVTPYVVPHDVPLGSLPATTFEYIVGADLPGDCARELHRSVSEASMRLKSGRGSLLDAEA